MLSADPLLRAFTVIVCTMRSFRNNFSHDVRETINRQIVTCTRKSYRLSNCHVQWANLCANSICHYDTRTRIHNTFYLPPPLLISRFLFHDTSWKLCIRSIKIY